MSQDQQSNYYWPASGLTVADMALLYRVRESTDPRVPITRLVAQAVREQYGHVVVDGAGQTSNQDKRKAA